MAVNKGEIGIYGVLKRDGGDGVIATADQIKDTLRDAIQEDLNAEYHAAKLSIEDHLEDTSNPHSVTKEQVGLKNVTNDAQVKRSEMGKSSGVATLDNTGKVPASQLPSFVNDVLEYDTLSNFPAKGEDGKIYVTLDTNLTYRWTGTQYIEISQSLAVGETADSAFAGSRGVAIERAIQQEVTDRVNAINSKVDKTTTINNKPLSSNITLDKYDIGLSNVDNTSDLNKPISTATQKELDTKFGNTMTMPKNTFCAAPATANGTASFRNIVEEDLSNALVVCTTDEINSLFT